MSSDKIRYEYDIDGDNFTAAGTASESVRTMLKQIGLKPELIRRISIAMYEGEINMVIHANGGKAIVDVSPTEVEIHLIDNGPGIPDVEQAMQEGYSTAPDRIRSLGFGAGMGLPNMKRYSDELKIDSVVGKGTTVYMKVSIT